MTGCFTRGHAIEVIDAELRRARRSQAPVSLIMFDVDRLKDVNDRHGHLGGDAVLAVIGKRMREVLRGSDLKCRYAGEQFLVLLPETPLAGAKRVAETLRREVADRPVPWAGENLRVTASFGLAQALPGEVNVQALIGRADHALYRAKDEGGNCVRIAGCHRAAAGQRSAVTRRAARLDSLDHRLRGLGHNLSRHPGGARDRAGPARRRPALDCRRASCSGSSRSATGRRLPGPRMWAGLALLGFLMNVVGNGFVVWAEQFVTSGLTAVLIASVPFWSVGVEACLPGGERVRWATLAGLAIGFAGIVVLVWPELSSGGAAGRQFVGGVIGIQLACFGWALGTSYTKRHPSSGDPLAATSIQMLCSGTMLLALATAGRRVGGAPLHAAHAGRDDLSHGCGIRRRLHRVRLRRPASADLHGVAVRVRQPADRGRPRLAAAR